MARDELELRGFRATTPDDLNDPPRFAQIVETTKDAFVLELRQFFDRNQTAQRLDELPTVEKYALGYGPSEDPYETTVSLFQEFPDVLEHLPHVIVTAGGVTNKRMTVGRPIMAQVQLPPRIETGNDGPYALVDGDILQYRTKPNGIDWTTSSVVFKASRFPTANPITAALPLDVARVFNEQGLYAEALAITGTGVRFQVGGPFGNQTPNAFEVLSGTSANVLSELGLTVGQSDDSENPARPPMNRYHMAGEVQVAIDVITTDVNTRRELADLVYSWATFWLERQHFELLGRSGFDESIADEHYQIIVHQEVTMSGEQVVMRPGDQSDKVHIQRVNIPVTSLLYIDRAVLVPSGPAAGDAFIVDSADGELDEDLPTPN